MLGRVYNKKALSILGSKIKEIGHRREAFFNKLYGSKENKIIYGPTSDCKISKDHKILNELIHNKIIKNKEERNTSNKSGKNIQIVLGKIPELDCENNIDWINNKKNFSLLLHKYFKKAESKYPSDLLVYDTNYSHIFFNMNDIIKFMVKECKFRKLSSGRIKGDFNDNIKTKQYLTYEYRNTKKYYFLGFNGNKGYNFISLLKINLKYLETPYK